MKLSKKTKTTTILSKGLQPPFEKQLFLQKKFKKVYGSEGKENIILCRRSLHPLGIQTSSADIIICWFIFSLSYYEKDILNLYLRFRGSWDIIYRLIVTCYFVCICIFRLSHRIQIRICQWSNCASRRRLIRCD